MYYSQVLRRDNLWIVAVVGLMAIVFGFMTQVPKALAVNTINTAQYLDNDNNGTVDRIRWTMDENVTVCTYEAGDWTVNTAGTINAAITGLSCAGNDAILDILITATASTTGGATDPIISYANQGVAGSVTLASGAMTAKANSTATDGARPRVLTSTYQDNGANGSVDRLVLTFTEAVNDNGAALTQVVLAANNLTAYTGNPTAVAGTGTATLTYTTAATTNLTGVSGATQPTFAYTAGGTAGNRIRDTSAATNELSNITATALTDAAIPVVLTRTYTDNGADGSVDRLVLTFSESVTYNGNDLTQFALVAQGLTGYVGTPTAVSGTSTATLTLTTPATTNLTGVLTGGTQPTVAYTQSGTAGNRVRDAASNDLASFTAATVSDNAAPIIVTRVPATSAGGILVDANVVVTFSESMTTAATEAATTVSGGVGTLVYTWATSDTVMTVNPPNNYARATSYTVTIAATAASSVAGDPDLTAATWNFSTVAASTSSSGGGGGGGAPVAVTTLTLSAPNDGQTLTAGTATNVTWSSSGTGISAIRVSLSSDEGFTFPTILSQSEINDGSFSWTPATTLTNGNKYRIKVEGMTSAGTVAISDISDTNFSVAGGTAPAVVVAPPPPQTTQTTQTTVIMQGPPAPTRIDNPVATPGLTVSGALTLSNGDRVMARGSNVVYLYTADGKRHAFFNETQYKTWYPNFDGVKVIPQEQLQSIALGKNMRIHAGTWLIKIQSDPKVYAVEPGGLLRWVPSEATAVALYGTDWARHVIDIDVSRFTDYYIGSPLAAKTYPNGSLISDDTGTYYIQNGLRRKFLSPDVFAGMNYQNSFVVPVTDITTLPGVTHSAGAIATTGPSYGMEGLELTPP